MKPVLNMDRVSFTYPGSSVPALSDLSLSMDAGECVCISGSTGCGKTTLLMAVQGLLKDGDRQGSISIHPVLPGLNSGMVFQNAETQILCSTVEDEAAFWPENCGMSADDIRLAVGDALDAVGLAGLRNRNVEALSAGQKHRLTIASVLSMKPGLILMDEPCGQLDAPGKRQLIEILNYLKQRGHSLLIADHELEPYRSIADRFVLMEKGRIQRISGKFPSEYEMSRVFEGISSDPSSRSFGPPAVEIRNLQVAGPEGDLLIDQLDLTVRRGEFVHIYGINGSGKSTFLKCVCGFVPPESGMIRIAGINRPRPWQLAGKAALLMQNPQRQLFEDTVFDEVAFVLKISGMKADQVRERVMETLEGCALSHLADRSPLTLSFGEQHRVALASVIVSEPEVLLLDEPFAGLDVNRRRQTIRPIGTICRDRKTAVIMASHNPLYAGHGADQSLALEHGRFSPAIFNNQDMSLS